MEKQRQKKPKDDANNDDPTKKEGIDLEGEDLSCENSYMPAAGKHKFDTMLKSMLARLEFCNYLAPVEDYGRH